jgi:hypothetical protein
LALAPNDGESFLREVDENLRRDRARDFFKKYGSWLIGAVVLFLAAVAGWLYWEEQQKTKAAQESEVLAQVYTDIGAGNLKAAPGQLDGLASSGRPVVRASALFTRAALALQQNDRATAVASYARIESDSDLPEAYRDLAKVRRTALQFDTLKPEQIIARMQPYTTAGNPWFGSAGELTAMALIKQGKKAEAGRMFAAIARDRGVPATIRSRAVQIAGTLGVDASASMPSIEQQGR